MERGTSQALRARIEGLYAACREAGAVNSGNLQTLLADNRETDYGRAHGFAELRTAQDYRARVPLTEYGDYIPYLQKGGAAALTVYPQAYELLSSGTNGAQKRFPLTKEALSRYASYIVDMPFHLSGMGSEGPHLHSSVFRTPLGPRRETLLSSAYYRHLEQAGLIDPGQYLGGRALLYADGVTQAPYLKLRLALACPALKSFQSIYLYDLVLIFRYLEENGAALLADMAGGRCSVPLPPLVRQALDAQPPPDKARLRQVERELTRGFDTPIVPRLWPELRFVSGIGGPVYRRQTAELRRYIGDLPVSCFAYASSECMAGVAARFDTAEYLLLPDSAFYEFLPVGGGTETLPPREAEPGARYELVVSTFSGLYRYRTGDILEVRGFRGETPRFAVCGRRSQLLDVAGEKLGAADLSAVMEELLAASPYPLGEYGLCADLDVLPGRYLLYVECGAADFSPESVAGELDRLLCAKSADYRDVRQLGLLDSPQVRRVPPGLLEQCARETAAVQSQRKPLLLLREAHIDYLRRALARLGAEFAG